MEQPKPTPTPITKPQPQPSAAAAQYGIKPTAPVQPKHIAPVYPVSPQDRKPAVTQPVEQPKHVDVSKIEVGTAVKHKTFGNGVIINKDKAGKFVTVKFSAGEKKFVLQDAFDRGFLSL